MKIFDGITNGTNNYSVSTLDNDQRLMTFVTYSFCSARKGYDLFVTDMDDYANSGTRYWDTCVLGAKDYDFLNSYNSTNQNSIALTYSNYNEFINGTRDIKMRPKIELVSRFLRINDFGVFNSGSFNLADSINDLGIVAGYYLTGWFGVTSDYGVVANGIYYKVPVDYLLHKQQVERLRSIGEDRFLREFGEKINNLKKNKEGKL